MQIHRGGLIPRLRARRMVGTLAALAFIAVACGGNGQEEGAAEAPEDAEGEPPADDVAAPADGGACEGEDVELEIWFGRDGWLPADEFETFYEEHPGISVEWDVIPLEQATTDFIRAHDAGNEPDIFQISSYEIPPLASGGYLADMTQEFQQWEEDDPESWNNLFQPLAVESSSWNETPHGLGLFMTPDWYLYRIDLLEEAGFDGPAETWDEVIEIARATTDQENGVYGYNEIFSRNQDLSDGPLTVFMAMGGQFDEDNYLILDSEAGIAWLEFYQTIIGEGLINPETLAWDSGDSRADMIAGNAAQSIFNQAHAARMQEEGGFEYGVDWAVAPPPVREGAEDDWRHKNQTYSYFVSSNTDHQCEAALLLRYLASEENLLEVQQRYSPSVSSAAWNSEALDDLPGVDVYREGLPDTVAIPVSPRVAEEYEIGLDAMQEAVLNPEVDAAEIAAKYQEAIDALKE